MQSLLAEIAGHLSANKTRISAGPRTLLESFLHLAQETDATRIPAVRLQSELGRRSGKAPDAVGLRKRLQRLNESLVKAKATFELRSSGGDIVVQPTGAFDEKRKDEKLQDALTGMSNQRARLDVGGMVEPIATPDSEVLSVFFSYAWLIDEEHQIQNNFFERLKEKLTYPPAEYAGLPKIKLWKDDRNISSSNQGDPQFDAACRRAFLGLLMVSNKFHHSPACMREADFFLTKDGENCEGKNCLVVGVNIRHHQMLKRFTAGTRITLPGPQGEHLLGLWSSGNAADRTRFVDQVADHIFRAAEAFAKASAASPPGRKDIEQVIAARKLHADAREMIEAFARHGSVSPDIAPTTASPEAKEGIPIVQHLVDWAKAADGNAPRLIAILGEFGMGKTVACQLFTQKLLELRSTDASLPMPIYFDLRDVDQVEDGRAGLDSLMQQMLRKAGDEAPSAREVIKYTRERGAIIVFDGIDELTNKLSHEAAIKLYRDLLSVIPSDCWVADNERRRLARQRKKMPGKMVGPRLVVSCRTHYFPDVAAQRGFLTGMERSRLEADADVAAYFMLPFNEKQIKQYLTLHLGDDEGQRAMALVEETYNLRELAERPILLRFIRETAERIEREKLAGRTINLARLYDIFVDQVFERDNPKHMIPPREKRLILQALATHLHARGQSEIGNEKLDEWFQGYVATAPRLAAALSGSLGLTLSEIFAQDLRNASLLVRPGETAFRFAHTSIREYFLASALHGAARAGRGASAWDVPAPTPETLTFVLQRHAIEEPPERKDFEGEFVRLLEAGNGLAVRRLAFALWRRSWDAGTPLPRPGKLDLSGLDLRCDVVRGAPSKLLPLEGSVWRGAQLHQTEFQNVDLAGADFSGANAPMARWLSCCFERAAFGDSNLTGSLWRDCSLPEGAIDRANLTAVRAHGCRVGAEQWRPQPVAPKDAERWRLRPLYFSASASVALGLLGRKAVIVSGGTDKTVRVHDLNSGAPLMVLEGHQSWITSVALGALGDRAVVASGGCDKTLRVHDLSTGESLMVLTGHQDVVGTVAVGSLGDRAIVVSGSDDGAIHVYDLESGAVLSVLGGHHGPVKSVSVGPLGGRTVVVSGGDDRMIRVHHLESGAGPTVLEGHHSPIKSVAMGSHGGQIVLASGGDDKTIRVHNLASGELLRMFEGHQDSVTSVALAPLDGKTAVVSGSGDHTIRVHDLTSGELLRIFEGHDNSVTSVAMGSPGGKPVIVSGSTNDTICVHDLASNAPAAVATLGGRGYWLTSVAIGSLGGKEVVVFGGSDKTIRVHDLASGAPLAFLDTQVGWVMSLAVGVVGGKEVVVFGGLDSTIRVHDLASGALVSTLKGHDEYIMSVALGSLDGRPVVVSGGGDKTIRVHDLASGEQLLAITGHQGVVRSVSIGLLGGKPVVASGGDDKTVRVHNLTSGEQLAIFEGHEDLVLAVTVGLLGKKAVVVSGGTDRTIRVHDLSSGELLSALEGHQGSVMSVAVSSVGGQTLLVSGSFDTTIRVNDLDSGMLLAVFEGHQDCVRNVTVGSVNGNVFIVSGGDDGDILVQELVWPDLDAKRKIRINGRTRSMVMLKSSGKSGDILVNASPDAWRYWAAEYQTGKLASMTDLDDMPRASAS
jgi:WD40 repeat protein